MKNKIPIYLDCDGTLIDSTKRLIYLLNQHYNTNKNYRDIKRYDCSDLFPNITQSLILEMFDKEEFFNDLNIFPSCKEILLKYKEDFDYQITTICTEKSLIHKNKYLNKELFPCVFTLNGIIKNGIGKGMIDMSNGIIIDDHIDNIRSSNAKYKILYKGESDTEWNDFDISDNCFVAKNWNEVDIILNDILTIDNLLRIIEDFYQDLSVTYDEAYLLAKNAYQLSNIGVLNINESIESIKSVIKAFSN